METHKKKYLVEGIGAFFLVLTVVMTSNNGTGALAPLCAGLMLAALIYAGAPVSGGHYNPAVSLAMLMRGKLDRLDFPYYVLAQVAGGVFAAFLGSFLLACSGAVDIRPHQHQALCSIMAELIGTFALVFVVFRVSEGNHKDGNAGFGLATGFVFSAVLYSLGSVSGGAFNPALAIGMTISGMASWADIWIYIVGGLLGAAAAATVDQVLVTPPPAPPPGERGDQF